MTARTAFSSLFVAFFPFIVAFGRLDYIDADGVTETGGPGKARMLTRTNSDGKIDASLIPPLSELVLTPDTQRLYVSSFAALGGDGSAVAPYRTLNDAFEHVMNPGSVVISPGPYSGTLTLKNAHKLTLIGCHAGSPISTLTITVSGTTASTELTLLSTYIGNLIVNGGKLTIRMQGSLIGTLSGSADMTVERWGLCSQVGFISAPHVMDSYLGYDTVPYAQTLKGASANLVLTGNRPTVGAETGAFLSDIRTATNAVYASLEEFRAADALLATAVANERTARLAGDAALGNALTNTADALRADISAIGGNWQTQLTALSQAIGTLSEGLSDLTEQETNDVARLTAADTAIRSAFASADASLHTTVRGEISDAINVFSRTVPGTATAAAEAVVTARRPAIITEAASQAKAYTDAEVGAVETEVSGLRTDLTVLQATVTSQGGQISAVQGDVTTLTSSLNAFQTTTTSNFTQDRGRITSLEGAIPTIRSDIETQGNTISLIKAKVNEIITFIKSKHSDCTISTL